MRGNIEAGEFSVFCHRGDHLLGIESVNRPARPGRQFFCGLLKVSVLFLYTIELWQRGLRHGASKADARIRGLLPTLFDARGKQRQILLQTVDNIRADSGQGRGRAPV